MKLDVKCKNKKFHHKDVVTMYLLKKEFVEKYLNWFAHGEPYVPYEIMLEMIVSSTSASNNMHGFVRENPNPCRSMVIDAMRMNQDYSSEGSHIKRFNQM